LVTYLIDIRPIISAIDGQLRTASGADVSYLLDQRDQVLSAPNIIGASGGISGVWIAFAYLFPNSLLYIYFLFPIKARYLAIFYVVFELYSAFNQIAGRSNDNIAHFAHLGGMLFGYIAVKYIFQTNRNHFY
jgi:membrane associated rhomboid family serine protease